MQVTIDMSWFKSFVLIEIGIIIVFKEIKKRYKIKSFSFNDLDKMSKNTTISSAGNGSAIKISYSSNNIRNMGGLSSLSRTTTTMENMF